MTNPSPIEASSSVAEPAAENPSTKYARLLIRRSLAASALLLILFTGMMTVTGGMDLLARSIMQQFVVPPPVLRAADPTPETAAAPAPNLFTFRTSDLHPAVRYAPYFGGPLPSDDAIARRVKAFQELLDLYEKRQGYDDNFTLRVLDNRTGELLERAELTTERHAYERTGQVDWLAIDRLRRIRQGDLSKKYENLGYPKGALSIRWGRANQVLEARQNEVLYIDYEIRLARLLGLSLLATEIGTVETFNTDNMVSSVGARSRYQMMPSLLRKNGIHRYALRTAYGKKVEVYEERHPLLVLEPAFVLLRGYVNAVGHEVAGLSAYHAGPFNIFKIYRLFLTQQNSAAPFRADVLDAYIWGLTDGFERVSAGSSFRTQSRGYVLAAYGALRATEALPINPDLSVVSERVQLKRGKSINLSALLAFLARHDDRLQWGPAASLSSPYERFRLLNPHIMLPASQDSTTLPLDGDLHLVDESSGVPVRFFLPVGAGIALQEAGLLDDAAGFTFDASTYATPPEALKRPEDRQYEQLVETIGRFGFTEENRVRLLTLADRFEVLAATDPSPYRRIQLQIIRTHVSVWRSSNWEELAAAVPVHLDLERAPVYPPDPVIRTLSPLPPRPLGK